MQLLLGQDAISHFKAGGRGGRLTIRASAAQDVGAVVAVSDSTGVTRPCPILPKTHFLKSCDVGPAGLWYRTTPELHLLWLAVAARLKTLRREAFAAGLERPLPTVAGAFFVVTYAPDCSDEVPDVLAWCVTPDGVQLIDFEVEPPPGFCGLAALAPGWPVEAVQRARLLLVGAGSIGSAVADALALYGIGHLVLVDPDRLRWHNLVRHRARPSDVGKYKVVALRDDLAVTRPATEVKPLTWNVVTDADRVRALLNDIDVVVCCADGVAPRRVVSHLARRARKPAVLSCVLEDGAVGEVMRLQPWTDHGCLNCRREALQECGGIDPEPALDARYGTGSTHRPMTAVGGDLHLVGQLTASIAVSTVLARAGSSGHRLPGEHLAVGLRTTGELAAPFDFDRSLDMRWSPATAPRAGCPTCKPDD
ncbi:HesA/MoeB/ThiF family protein [Pseudonocardia benzenivorans]|uniref:HesA/MoeB/ThiF family protein n=2 Tax=Pseudonocardia benzenivorans TaxID=228005 RepID=A0ABW3VUL1_9PSEU